MSGRRNCSIAQSMAFVLEEATILLSMAYFWETCFMISHDLTTEQPWVVYLCSWELWYHQLHPVLKMLFSFSVVFFHSEWWFCVCELSIYKWECISALVSILCKLPCVYFIALLSGFSISSFDHLHCTVKVAMTRWMHDIVGRAWASVRAERGAVACVIRM